MTTCSVNKSRLESVSYLLRCCRVSIFRLRTIIYCAILIIAILGLLLLLTVVLFCVPNKQKSFASTIIAQNNGWCDGHLVNAPTIVKSVIDSFYHLFQGLRGHHNDFQPTGPRRIS